MTAMLLEPYVREFDPATLDPPRARRQASTGYLSHFDVFDPLQSWEAESPPWEIKSPLVFFATRAAWGFLKMGGTGMRPDWVKPVLIATSKLLELEPNWDTYGGHPIDPGIATRGLRILSMIASPGLISPHVVPTSAGGLQFEWHESDIDLELELMPDGRVFMYFEDLPSGRSVEREVTHDWEVVREKLLLLSRE